MIFHFYFIFDEICVKFTIKKTVIILFLKRSTFFLKKRCPEWQSILLQDSIYKPRHEKNLHFSYVRKAHISLLHR